MATTLTLVPALLSAAGRGCSWPRRKPADGAQPALGPRRRAPSSAHRWLTIVGTTAVLLALAAPVLTLTLGSPQLTGLAAGSPQSRAAEAAVAGGVPAGVLRPVEVLVPEDDADVGHARAGAASTASAASPPRAARWAAEGEQLVQVWLADDPASARRPGRARPGPRRPPTTWAPASAAARPRTPTS